MFRSSIIADFIYSSPPGGVCPINVYFTRQDGDDVFRVVQDRDRRVPRPDLCPPGADGVTLRRQR